MSEPADTAAESSELTRVLVIIPTYNEADNISSIVSRTRAAVPEADILIVDDNSPDGTGKLADQLAAADQQIKVLHRTSKSGLGGAYLAGFEWGIEREYDVLCEMDADGSHRPEELPRLLAKLSAADLVLGARWVPGGRVINWPKSREALSRGANLWTRLALGMPVREATSGFRAFRRSTLQRINLAAVASAGYCFQIDLTWRAVQAGMRIAEVPITFEERTAGQSKMSKAIVFEALTRTTSWGIRHRTNQVRGALRKLRPALSKRKADDRSQ